MGKWILGTPFIGDKELEMYCGKQFRPLKREQLILFDKIKCRLSPKDQELLEAYTKVMDSLSGVRADVAYVSGAIDQLHRIRENRNYSIFE